MKMHFDELPVAISPVHDAPINTSNKQTTLITFYYQDALRLLSNKYDEYMREKTSIKHSLVTNNKWVKNARKKIVAQFSFFTSERRFLNGPFAL